MADDSASTAPKPGKTVYSAETKAAVLAALLAGQGVTEVAAAYAIPEGTVKAWRSHSKGNVKSASSVLAKREQIGELLIDYLHGNLKTLKAHQRVFADPEWLKQQ